MATGISKLDSHWLKAAILMILVFSAVQAETPQDEDSWTPVQTPAQSPVQTPALNPIWIQDPFSGDTVLTYVGDPDYSLWNAKRITDYEESLEVDTAPPLGVLTIEKLDIQVAVYNGTEEVILDRGAGRIKGMAKMDEAGNLGISGHRDGFFRSLKDIQKGDEIKLQTTRGVENYTVSSITILDKKDISPLAATDDNILTLVTCYPFYFVGNAPKRFIVKATAGTTVAEIN
jgi:LPXTG-site transpeptidase (sortase) family protein